MEWTFTGEVIEWRGPAPFYFVEATGEADAFLHANLAALSYGWGCVYAEVTVDGRSERTSLMPRNDVYLVPLKAALRRASGIGPGDTVTLTLTVADP